MDTRSSDTTSASGSQFAEGHSLAPNHTCCYIHMVCSSWLLPPKPHPNHTRTLTIPDAHPNHLQTMCQQFGNLVLKRTKSMRCVLDRRVCTCLYSTLGMSIHHICFWFHVRRGTWPVPNHKCNYIDMVS